MSLKTERQFVVSIMSRDRVGIVTEVAQVLSHLDGDIADIRMSVLRGYFTMILIAAFPSVVNADRIRHRLNEINLTSGTPLEIVVRESASGDLVDDLSLPEDAYVLTASGRDRIGFVAAVANFCARHHINILDLSTTAADERYIMILIVDLSAADRLDVVYEDMRNFEKETGFQLVLQHQAIFAATNEV